MPFIYDPSSWSPHSSCPTGNTTTSHTSHFPNNSSTSTHKMPSFGLFHRKSNKSNSNIDRTASVIGSSSPMTPRTNSIKLPAPATRRPANPPTLANPFKHNNNSEPPPSYTPAPPTIAPSTDNPYAFLSTFDTVFLIDDSGSMSGQRWKHTRDALKAITPICTKHDSDGIDIHFFNTPDSPTYMNITSPESVERIFAKINPGGGTPTGARLNAILKPYIKECERVGADRIEEIKPLNIIVITDGEAHDDPESVILNVAKKLDKLDAPAWQLGIQFFQVGNDPLATQALNDLDDGIQDLGCERDIVDTVPWTGADSGIVGLNAEGILKVVLLFTDVWTGRGTLSIGGRAIERLYDGG